MLRITMCKSADSAKKYYCEKHHAEGRTTQQDYYSEHDAFIGRWGGKAAASLGLTGNIEKKDFASICDNFNPVTGKRLTARTDKDRSIGYDFTFNAFKSISIAYALGDDAEKKIILEAFNQSVRDAMTEIESGMQTRVRVKGKDENRLTGNIAYGEFTHFSTRPVDGVADPHLHSHLFVFNITRDSTEDKWKAGQFRQINQDAPYYEAIFHSKLAHNLQTAGYAIERTKNGFELQGVGKDTIEKFSRRTQEIEAFAEEHHITDAKQKAQIGANTRASKNTHLSAEAQEHDWRSRLNEAEAATIKSLRQRAKQTAVAGALNAQNGLQFALHHHLERRSVVSDKEILASAIKSSVGNATPEQVQRAFDRDSNILAATEKLRTFITTKEALAEEKRLIRSCIESQNIFRPINKEYEPQNATLNEQQRAAVRHALNSTDAITLINGKAGTGKTTLMREVQDGIIAAGKRIYAFAPSSEASRGVQRSEGFENAETVARLIQDKRMHDALKGQIIWVDEAGMLSNRDMNEILAIAKAQNARVILSGDTAQHTAVQRGDALRIIEENTTIRPVTVDKIQRQKNAGYKEAVSLLSSGKTAKGFAKLEQIGAIHEIEDSAARIDAISEDYYRSAYGGQKVPIRGVLVVAPTHAEGDQVTLKIRQKLKEHHAIGQNEREFGVLKSRQFTEAEKQRGENYHDNDFIVFHQHGKGIKAGTRLRVLHTDGSALQAEDKNGNLYTVPLETAKKFSVYEPQQVSVSEGDKIRITANGKDSEGKHLFNGSTFRIERFDEQGRICLSNGSTLPADFGHFNLGYVSTSHASQGKTEDKVIISQSSATFRASSTEQFYVSVSRGRQAVSIYTDDKEQLKQAVSHSGERTSATELMATRQQQAEEINRQHFFQRWQEKAAETYNHFKAKYHSYAGLQTETRTEQDYAR